MTLNGVLAVTLRYFTEFGQHALQKTICGGICVFLERVQCRRKESSRSLSHFLMSFLFSRGDKFGDAKKLTPFLVVTLKTQVFTDTV